ncbi:MAG: acyl-CoA dehydrogenase [Hyphomicrobiales bacterium]|nr:MAG: acyl-CoA dehydrogenase [Hyphomicrobiales bacterium]
MSYNAPVADISFTLKQIVGLSEELQKDRFGDLSDDLVDAIIEEAGKFAGEEIAPLNRVGDTVGAKFADGKVTMPEGWSRVYDAWAEAGWASVAGPVDYGGQGLPQTLAMATLEMWNSASMAFALGPTLTSGAIEAIDAHASDELKDIYLAKLVSGEWMATMNLTEPQAGSDLNALRARAERAGDGTYRIFGQKIFISYGEHDLTDNIIHLVLARLPDAPAGTRGISLFLVPKFLVNEDGSIGARNDAVCASVEHKLGIHSSPTCTMIYGDNGGAIGWLVGEENRGLACMFTMMNNARLAVGIQGVALAEGAFQKALTFAEERRQGRALGATEPGMSAIVDHPDVRRNLLIMKSFTRAARAICYACAHATDMAEATDGDDKKYWQERANLITPIAKAFSTDIGFEVSALGVMVHGGMGYVEETGAAQYLRDARIAAIYEGTNGIQAIDLVNRKLPQSGGEAVRAYIAELRAIVDEVKATNHSDFGIIGERLSDAFDNLTDTTEWMLTALGEGRIGDALAGATPYLRIFGLASGGAYLAKGALASARAASGSAAETARIHVARFFAETLVGETAGLARAVKDSSQSVLAADAALLSN